MSDLRSRGWLLTIFEQPEGKEKRTEESISEMLDPLPWMGQLEEGHETHHRHFQIYVEAPNALRFSTIKKKAPDAHIEPRKGTQRQAFDYCSKSDTRLEGPFFHGIDKPGDESSPGQRMDLSMISDALLSGMSVDDMLVNPEFSPRLARCMNWARSIEQAVMAKAHEEYKTTDREVEVHYIWGEPGIGKTYSIKTQDDIFEPSYDGKWDGYSGQDSVLFDEFAGQIPLYQMNRYLEGYRDTRLPARYHDLFACYHHVFIVSNYPPEHFYNHEQSWLRRLTTVEHATWYSTRNLVFAHGECEEDWDALLNPDAPGDAVDESIWRCA
jgi:hypothetical protein